MTVILHTVMTWFQLGFGLLDRWLAVAGFLLVAFPVQLVPVRLAVWAFRGHVVPAVVAFGIRAVERCQVPGNFLVRHHHFHSVAHFLDARARLRSKSQAHNGVVMGREALGGRGLGDYLDQSVFTAVMECVVWWLLDHVLFHGCFLFRLFLFLLTR